MAKKLPYENPRSPIVRQPDDGRNKAGVFDIGEGWEPKKPKPKPKPTK